MYVYVYIYNSTKKKIIFQKFCTTCKKKLPLKNFNVIPWSTNYYRCFCKQCEQLKEDTITRKINKTKKKWKNMI